MILRQKKKGSWGFSKEVWLLSEQVYKRWFGKEGQPEPSEQGPGMYERRTSEPGLWTPRPAHSPATKARRERDASSGPRVDGRSRCRPAGRGWLGGVTEGPANGSLNDKEPGARGCRRSHLHQAPAGSRAAARETACSPRSGDPAGVFSPAGSNWPPPSRSRIPARESIKLLLKGPRFTPGTGAGKRRGSHPRGLCGATSLLGNVVSMRKLALLHAGKCSFLTSKRSPANRLWTSLPRGLSDQKAARAS